MYRNLCAVLTAVVLCPAVSIAETPPPFPEFSAKRVGLPKGNVGRRITIQIDPALAAQPPVASQTEPEVAPDAQIGTYAWFWQDVAPDITVNGAQRAVAAVEAIERVAGGARDIAAPRAQDLRLIIETYGTDILMKSLDTKVSPALALAVIAVESSGRIDAVSSAGAKGLMQLMPATAERFGVTDTTASENIRGGIEYLDWLIRHFEGDPVLALAGYNAGEGAVKEHGGVPPYPETRDYVPKVLSAWHVARLLCKTPPTYLEDGCVFEGKLTPG